MNNFEDDFKSLMTFKPLKWQRRLYAEHFALGMPPDAIDIPTGLGKTSVMAIWYLALRAGALLPRRLVYVVDRRAVVDQATTIAEEIKVKSGDKALRISTLRGEHVDNREWLADPAAAAIIVGTVDMIGSRLLFSGYGVSRKMRPYHAGLLGADTLVVLDESHLVPPFERLLEAIETRREFSTLSPYGGVVPKFKLLSLSATGGERKGILFRLDESKGDLNDDVVKKRLGAKKDLILQTIAKEKKLGESLAGQAWVFAHSNKDKKGIRVLVYCNSREVAEDVKKEIERTAKGDRRHNVPATDVETELFVGARRVKERVDAAEKLMKLGFLAGSDVKLEKPAFLIATSAGEVGVDLDADHMVCDLVSWERMVQRLGRVNRRGEGEAQVVVIMEAEPTPSKKEQAAFDKRNKGDPIKENEQKLMDTFGLKLKRWGSFPKPIQELPESPSGFNASPGALRDLKLRAEKEPQLQKKIQSATTPLPLYPALTRALVDAWSMTSLEKHTGRPEIAPWLRGWIEEDEPQTTVVWRKYLPVRAGADSSDEEIEEFFEAATPHLSEKLETETWRVVDWLMARATRLHKPQEAGKKRIIAFTFASDGALRGTYSPQDLVEKDGSEKKRKEQLNTDLAGTMLIVDARLGGLKDGLLDKDTGGEEVRTADDGGEWTADIGFRIQLISGNSIPSSTQRITYSFAVERSSEGEDIERLFVESRTTEESRAAATYKQLLEEHRKWAEECARKTAGALGLTGNHTECLATAARLHDEGKQAPRWQRAFNAPQDGVYAKTVGPLFQSRLAGYRHEFGSLPYVERDEGFNRLPLELQELVLHLIAAHHGRARPTIEIDSCDDAPPSLLEARAGEVALRFARLQKRWGPWGLAWWEALLRAADQQASTRNDSRENANGRS